jgi:glutamyl-tRNA synthetase
VLRIEDTDESRNRPEWVDGIVDALAWVGISDDDPCFEGPHLQSHHAGAHVAAATRLFEAGAAYYCDLSPDEVQQRARETGTTGYDGYSRDRGLGPAPGRVLRFRVPEGGTVVSDAVRGEVTFDNSTIEDFVLLRGNGSPMFLLANVVDDIEMSITDVVRAEEHLPNTPKQQMLWEALGRTPPRWGHVPVLVNEQRKKLSKRRDKVALEQFREEGILADAMVNYLMTLGWTPPGDSEIVPWSVVESAFRLEDVNLSPAFFDVKKLAAFNGEYIRMMSHDDLVDAAVRELPAGWDPAPIVAMIEHLRPRLVTLRDVPGLVDFFHLPEGGDVDFEPGSWAAATSPGWTEPLLVDTVRAYEAIDDWSADALKGALEAVMTRFDVKLGKAQAPVRVAITGRSVGPPLFESMEVLGRHETLRRLRHALDVLAAEPDRERAP